MNILVFLLLVLLPTCHSQNDLDCPGEVIKKDAKTKDFLLTSSVTEISFSKSNESRYGAVNFSVKCSEQEKFWLELVQKDDEVLQVRTNITFSENEFLINDPAKMTFILPGDNLTISILDKENSSRKLVEGVPLSPGHVNCTLSAHTLHHYVVWFPCQPLGSRQANLWYLLFLPVFLALFGVLFFYREKLMKFSKKIRGAPSGKRN